MNDVRSQLERFGDIKKILLALQDDVDRVCQADEFGEKADFFATSVLASFYKAHQFCKAAYSDTEIPYVFLFGSVRTLCEELIFLSAISEFSPEDRNEICKIAATIEVEKNIKAQSKFLPNIGHSNLYIRVQRLIGQMKSS